jgi:hypothetical protein
MLGEELQKMSHFDLLVLYRRFLIEGNYSLAVIVQEEIFCRMEGFIDESVKH